ncbi:hypothetical protein SAMN05428959_1011421 [Duganella sp. CF517]|uniref:hypothetical protein n=1 Tax=Duganella sp. CF517 TaxID=1881038 RepID=UPI0008C9B0AB|nr:hypothetical protein [Duganella sp. CF517]SEN37459.1 hypothetical protein SAMN05428959_1011421 [Duganella sp. CF517]
MAQMKTAIAEKSDRQDDGRGRRLVRCALLALGLCGCAPAARALDTYRGDFVFNNPDYRDRYALAVLKAALEASSEKYGPFELTVSPLIMERDRLMQEMGKGGMVNLTAQVTSVEWERKLIPIRIPVDKGFSGYRIFLIDGRRQARFSAVTSLPQLKELSMGAGRQWGSTPVLLQNGFKVVTGASVHNLQAMLAAERFLFFPRSVEEAVFEREAYAPGFPMLAIENELALYMPLARYFFVAPGEPRLAQRLEFGMRALSADGRLDRLFHQAYDGLIEQVGLRKRRIFRLENPLLPPKTPLANKAYWYDPVARP